MAYSFEDPLNGLKFWNQPVFDAHIHVWSGKFYPKFVHWVKHYYKEFFCLGMMNEEAKSEIPVEYWDNIVFTYYLSTKAFGTFDIKTLQEELDKAHSNEYYMIKIWLAPRMIDFVEGAQPGFRVNDERLDPVFQKNSGLRFSRYYTY